MRFRHLHHLAAPLVALLAAALLTLSGGTAPAWAAAQRAAARHARAVPMAPAARINAKVTLPQSSIDGPALAGVGTTTVIGWTGTDAAHHLNLEISHNELQFDPATKLTLGETSPFRPDVTFLTENSAINVAWTGSDANHSLNVLHGAYQRPEEKLALRTESSFTAPALLQGPNSPNGISLFLAWTGVNANHTLNFLPITENGGRFTLGAKQVLSQFSSNAGPHLALRGTNTIVLSWTSRTGHLMVATSSDHVHFPTVSASAQLSAFAPSTVSFTSEGQPGDWMGWTGTDAAHHLNVQWTNSFPNFPNPAGTKTTLSDMALGGPALAFSAGQEIAWTGTDAAHHLNIARFEFS